MPTATQPQPLPNPLIYDFEGQFEDAFTAGFANVVPQVSSQQDQPLLTTPRFDVKFMSGQQEQESYIVQGTGTAAPNSAWSYQNRWKGTLYVKVTTNRLDDQPNLLLHRTARATMRMMMINFINTVNPGLKFISIVQSLESSTQPDIVAEHDHDVSAIAFNVFFSIKNSAFPVPT